MSSGDANGQPPPTVAAAEEPEAVTEVVDELQTLIDRVWATVDTEEPAGVINMRELRGWVDNGPDIPESLQGQDWKEVWNRFNVDNAEVVPYATFVRVYREEVASLQSKPAQDPETTQEPVAVAEGVEQSETAAAVESGEGNLNQNHEEEAEVLSSQSAVPQEEPETTQEQPAAAVDVAVEAAEGNQAAAAAASGAAESKQVDVDVDVQAEVVSEFASSSTTTAAAAGKTQGGHRSEHEKKQHKSIDQQTNRVIGETVKDLGARIATDWEKNNPEGSYLSPLLAAFAVRCVLLEAGDPYNYVKGLTLDEEHSIMQATVNKLSAHDDPLVETMKMQVTFESLYASELQRLRKKQRVRDAENKQQLDKIVEIGTNIQSNTQVASLYRSIFKLMLANSCVDPTKIDRSVEREIAAALESVFPQAGLNAFNMMSGSEKRKQVSELVSIVLGIRLFNLEIKKGGAGISDVPSMATTEVNELHDRLLGEATEMGDMCFTYSDILALEYKHPGTIAGSIERLQTELTNRRQFTLLIHQLQHEVLESLDMINEDKERLFEEMEQLKTLVGLRSSVPKEQVYPKFHSISATWQSLIQERERNKMRKTLLQQLLVFKDTFNASLLDHDVELVTNQPPEEPPRVNYEAFVETVAQRTPNDTNHIVRDVPVRLIQATTPHFLSLPLEHQGYCAWSLVNRRGLLIPGNPSIGTIFYKDKHYSFATGEALRDFVSDPEKYVEGVVDVARKIPALIHLLCIQADIPQSDISDLFNITELSGQQQYAFAVSQREKITQTPSVINTDIPDPDYEWNEWTLRRAALQMADLCNKKTHSTQTELSQFRRDAETQVYLPRLLPDGTMAGVATQTGIDKATNVRIQKRFISGLRGRPTTRMQVVQFLQPEVVEERSNSSLVSSTKERQFDPVIVKQYLKVQ